MRLFLLLSAMAAVSRAQTDCSVGACYPPVTDLLLSRGHQLHATSTCGLSGSEIYCTPYEQIRMKCCPCDSRNPDGPLAHTIKEVLSSAKPDRWWQSRKELSPVTLQFDPQNLFQLNNLVLNFKGPRPSSLVIERTLDKGQTWEPALYLSTDCQENFPGVPTVQPRTLEQTYCQTLPPMGASPYQDQTVQFSPLQVYSAVALPNSRKIGEVSGLTGLRVRLTQLGDVPRPPGRALSRFYALRDMRVMGSCMCHGHANRCLPQAGAAPLTDSLQADCPDRDGLYPGNLVLGAEASHRCDCQHNTAGPNCERCADLYQDKPWRAAEENEPHVCQRCQCNNHAQRCHFDAQLYEASGRVSGGVCDECMHHTTGARCDQCAPGYQPNPRSQMDRPDACIRCFCNADGSVNGGRCDDDTGTCQCKLNVEGARCDRCKKGFHSLSPSNPLGCSKCQCSSSGSLSDVCDPATGQCRCQPHFHGLTCDVCANGYWRAFQSGGCEPCRCDASRSLGDSCNMLTGQCECKPGFGGRRCTECPDNSYGEPLIGCKPCLCNKEGTLPEVCNKQTGACLCRPGVAGTRCDSCRPGHCDSFPDCMSCPLCYFDLDGQRRSLSADLQKLSQQIPTTSPGDLGKFEPRIRDLEEALKQLKDSLSFPPAVAQQIDKALTELDQLRDRADEADKNLSPLQKTPGLTAELDRLQALLDGLTLLYNNKKDGHTNTVDPNSDALLAAIRKAYDESKASAAKVEDTKDTVRQSEALREDAVDRQKQVQPANTRELSKLSTSMANQPDLTAAAKQVCGSTGAGPCTPLSCPDTDLCPPEGAPLCEAGKCQGALPLSKRADADVREVTDRLDKLSSKITEAAEKFQDAQEKTNQVRQTAEKLSDKVKQTREELDGELKDTGDVLKQLKDLLSGPAPNLTQIQDISDKILKVKLPLSMDALNRKVAELKNLAAKLPDSSEVLNKATPQLEAARKLLQEAEEARDTAVNNNVTKLVREFDNTENVLSDLEEKLQDSMDQMDGLKKTLTEAEAQLSPAEKALDDASTVLTPLQPQVEELEDRLQNGDQLLQDAQDDAQLAKDMATAADQDMKVLEDKVRELKDLTDKGTTPDGGTPEDRLAKLRQDAVDLTNTTDTMADALKGKADSIRQLQDEVVQKAAQLDGLEEKLQDLLATLRKKAEDLSTCSR
ncbi:laminin subunit beta-3 [Synchiropus splendidus]|uniref:laminin subunit beta-3 n=1 Tax=Synchiropus splendidus TaxID=270530 RepID=UPI00237E9A89|nr:laminin subunit beta-3 [Synchiropus splendidus]